jgi:hypothetical protein
MLHNQPRGDTAGPGAVSRIIAGWPAVALLIAVKLLSGMLGQHTGSGRPPSRPTRAVTRPLAIHRPPTPSRYRSAYPASPGQRPQASYQVRAVPRPPTGRDPSLAPKEEQSPAWPPSPTCSQQPAAPGTNCSGTADTRRTGRPTAREGPPSPELPPHAAARSAPRRDHHRDPYGRSRLGR